MSLIIFSACQLCCASGDTNIIAMSEWSKAVLLRNDQLHDQAIRGRLVIVEGMEPAYGNPPTANGAITFVELQNMTRACCDDIDVCFDVTKLNCELSDGAGKLVPKPTGMEWGGRGPFAPCWVKLPYNSTIRLFVNGGTRNPLAVFPSGVPWCRWSIAANDTNTYFLSGTLSLFTHTNLALSPPFREMDYQEHRTATLAFPKTRITASRMASREKPKYQ